MCTRPRHVPLRHPHCIEWASIRFLRSDFGLFGECAEASPRSSNGERQLELHENGGKPYRETGGGRMKRRICRWRAMTMGSAWGAEAPNCTITITAAAIAAGTTVCMTMHNWQ